MVERADELREFSEIPADWKKSIEEEVARQAFDTLHAEAVARGDLPAAPRTLFDAIPGRILLMAFHVLFGFLLGIVAVVIILQVMRQFRTIV